MKYVKSFAVFEDHLYESFDEKKLQDDKHSMFVQYTVPYGNSKIFLYLRFLKHIKAVRVDFDNKDYTLTEGISDEQMSLFSTFKELIIDFKKKTNSQYIYFQAKKSRENLYDRLLKSFDTPEFTRLDFRTDKIKDGKKWYFFIDKKYDTPQLRSEIKTSWENTVEYYGSLQIL